MKAAVVYYSMSGNTELVAQQVATALDADVVALVPKKEYPNKGFKKFLWGGRSALIGERPPLKPYDFDPDKYDFVVLGSPVWAGQIAPPLRTFVTQHAQALQAKTLAAYVCCGGPSPQTLGRLQQLLGGAAFAATLVSVDPKDRPDPAKQQEIESFCAALRAL